MIVDPRKKCSQQCRSSNDQNGDTIAYSLQDDPDDQYSMINFCPSFFDMRRLRDAALDYGQARRPPLNYWLKNYDNTARVFLHELFHLDYFMDVNGANHIMDLSLSFDMVDDDGEPKEDIEKLMVHSILRYWQGIKRSKILSDTVRAGM